jgi:sec-independent protein translocase protein TatA
MGPPLRETGRIEMFGGVGGSEVLLIAVLVLVLFGSKRMPEFARGVGKAAREIRKAVAQIRREIESSVPDKPPDRPSDKAG